MTFLKQSIQSAFDRREQLPALRAASLLLVVLVAAMFRLGAFTVLIALHILFDIYASASTMRKPGIVRITLLVLSKHLLNIILLLGAVVATVYLNQSLASIAALSGLWRSLLTIVRALVVFLPKFLILPSFLSALCAMPRTQQTVVLNPIHLATASIFIVLLLLAPATLGLSSGNVLQVIGDAFLPLTP